MPIAKLSSLMATTYVAVAALSDGHPESAGAGGLHPDGAFGVVHGLGQGLQDGWLVGMQQVVGQLHGHDQALQRRYPDPYIRLECQVGQQGRHESSHMLLQQLAPCHCEDNCFSISCAFSPLHTRATSVSNDGTCSQELIPGVKEPMAAGTVQAQ